MSQLMIRLFGGVRVCHDDRPSDMRITRTTQKLLAYLLLQRSYSPREALACLCWCDQPEDHARSSLSTALWRLRRLLEPDETARGAYLITSATGDVSFNWESRHWLDLAIFEQAASKALAQQPEMLRPPEAAELTHALTLYTGDLLEGLYDDWALRERERVRAMYLDSLCRLMIYHRHRGAYAESIAAGHKILALDPLREEVHRELMRLYLASGERASAIRQYQACRDALAVELDIAPMVETETLYRQILAETEWPPRRTPPATPLALPEALQELRSAMQQLQHAQGQLSQAMALVERLSGDKL